MAIRGGFKIADAYVELTVDRDALRQGVRDLPRDVGPDADRAGGEVGKRIGDALVRDASGKLRNAKGRLASDAEMALAGLDPVAERRGSDVGGKLSRGIQMSIVRNSPLIVAAVGAALALGAPLMLTAATALFAGIGIVAAAQSQKVQSAWLSTWQQIKSGAQADAGPIEQVLVGMAARVGAGFEQLRPSLRNIFADAAPQIRVFTDGIMGLATNAMPGFERAIARGMPVTQGFASFLEQTGTGLTRFFDAISAHSPAAGKAFDALGRIMAALLPILGELMGSGVELASIVLPPLASVLEVVADALKVLQPILPAVAMGFAAFKVASAAAGWIGSLGTAVSKFSAQAAVAGAGSTTLGTGMGVARAGATGLASALGGPLGVALAGIGVAVGYVTSQVQKSRSAEDEWAMAFVNGGAAARQAMADYEESRNRIADTGIGGWLQDVDEWLGLKPSIDDARTAAEEFTAKLDPMARAQQAVTKAQNDLSFAVEKYGPTSSAATGAANDLADAQAEVARIAAEEERAIRGVTEAMIAQVNQARAAVDANFAMELAIDAIEDAQTRYNEAVKENGKSSEEASDALRDLQMRYRDAGAAAAELATSELPAAMDDQQKAIIGAKAELEYYHGILAKGVDLPPSMDEYVAKLERQVGAADGATLAAATLAAALAEVGITASTIPDEKAVRVDALTDVAISRLQELGLRVERQKDGSFKVIADTAAAEGNLDKVSGALAAVDKTVVVPKVDADTKPLHAATTAAQAELQRLAAQRPTPKADLDSSGFGGSWFKAMRDIGTLAGQRPTPVAGLTNSPLVGSVQNSLSWLGGLNASRPTPVAGLNAAPFASTAGWLGSYMSTINRWRANPYATLHPDVGYAEAMLNYVARNRVSYITAITTYRPGSMTGPQAAGGGNVGRLVRGFAGGGTPSRRADGRISGPGGPLDDLVPALTNLGEFIRVANEEWIVRGVVSRAQGDWKMGLLNAGKADIVPRQAPRRFADGGSSAPGMPRTFAVSDTGRTLTVERVDIHIDGTFDLASSNDLRRAAVKIRQALIDLEREQS